MSAPSRSASINEAEARFAPEKIELRRIALSNRAAGRMASVRSSPARFAPARSAFQEPVAVHCNGAFDVAAELHWCIMPAMLPRTGLWRHADFMRLWSAQAVSAFGSRITRTALPIIAVQTLHQPETVVALLSSVYL